MNNPVTNSSDISYASQAGVRHWDEIKHTVIGRLRIAEAYLARVGVSDWEQRRERKDWIKYAVGPLIREAEPAAILGDSHLCGMVRELWGEAGVQRLRDRVAQCATRNGETPTTQTS